MRIITLNSIKEKIKRATPRFEQNLFLLFFSSQIRTVGINLLGTFGVIFFFQKFDKSILFLLFFYFLGSFFYIFLAPITGKIICKMGLKKSIIFGSILFAIINLTYILFEYNVLWAIISCTILTLLSRAFYWIPYHIYFASFTNKENRGFQISVIKDVVTIINIFLPIVASFFINRFGFNIIFIISIILHLISIMPLLKMDDINLKYSFNYFESFKKIFSKDFWHDSVLFFLEGAEGVSSVILWPIMIFLVLKNDFTSLGILSSAIILFTIITNLIIGKLSDKKSKKNIIKAGAILYSFGWFMKMFSFSSIQLFLSSLYHNISDSIIRVSYDSYWYDEDFKKGDYIDEYIVLRESTIHAGRSFMIIVTIVFMTYFNFTLRNTFLFGALSFILMGLFIRQDKKLIDEVKE